MYQRRPSLIELLRGHGGKRQPPGACIHATVAVTWERRRAWPGPTELIDTQPLSGKTG